MHWHAQVILDACQDQAQLSSLQHLTLGGEVLNPTMLAQARRMMPQAALFNVYGECRSRGSPCPRSHLHHYAAVVRFAFAASV